jgi:hypothetical protein
MEVAGKAFDENDLETIVTVGKDPQLVNQKSHSRIEKLVPTADEKVRATLSLEAPAPQRPLG